MSEIEFRTQQQMYAQSQNEEGTFLFRGKFDLKTERGQAYYNYLNKIAKEQKISVEQVAFNTLCDAIDKVLKRG